MQELHLPTAIVVSAAFLVVLAVPFLSIAYVFVKEAITGGVVCWKRTTNASWPRSSSAAACSSACSTTAPQNDHENGTTIPIFTTSD
mgnify:CR=1 FL=1